MKTCTLCKIEKPLEAFGLLKKSKDGRSYRCAECCRAKCIEYYYRNKEAINAKSKDYREKHKERLYAYKRAWDEARRDYRLEKGKEYYQKNIAEIKVKRAAIRKRDAKKIAEAQRIWKSANREHVNAYNRIEVTKRYREDPLFAVLMNSRRRLNLAFEGKGYSKRTTTYRLLGCTLGELKSHLESLFAPGMTWENRGLRGWHVDHIVPLSSASTVEELECLCHYTNLQPLWASENIAKGASLPEDYHERLGNLQAKRR